MTNEDTIDTHPAVIAAKQNAAREVALKQADRMPEKVKYKSEAWILRKLVISTHAALCDYDKLESPPNLAGTLAMTFDMIVARLDELSSAHEAKSAGA